MTRQGPSTVRRPAVADRLTEPPILDRETVAGAMAQLGIEDVTWIRKIVITTQTITVHELRRDDLGAWGEFVTERPVAL